MNHFRKITARTMGLKKFVAGQSYIVFGKARRYEVGQSDFGQYTKFRGQFEAVNENTGEQAASSVTIFPGSLREDELMEAIDNADGVVEVAVRFFMVENDQSLTGVSWTAERLVENRSSDPLADLRSQLSGALPAPSQEATEDSQEAQEASTQEATGQEATEQEDGATKASSGKRSRGRS